MSLSNIVASAQTFTIGQTSITVKPFTINEIAKLQDWIDRTYKSPLVDILPTLHLADPEIRRQLVAEAKRWTAPQFGTQEADSALQSIKGLRQVFRIIVTASDPKLTETDADRIAGEVRLTEFMDAMAPLMVAAFGASEESGDPKAPESPSTGTE